MNADWKNVRLWAAALAERHPRADLLSLSDGELRRMMSALDQAKDLPAPPDDGVYLWAVKSAWAEIRDGGSAGGGVSDANI